MDTRRNIRNIHHVQPEFIKNFSKIKPSTYLRNGNFEYGLIAEELNEISEYKPFVKDGVIDYDRLVVLAIAKIQEQQTTINNLGARIDALEKLCSKMFS